MKKTLLRQIPGEMPEELRRFVSGAKVYDSSCSAEASVYFIDRGRGYYLKRSEGGALETEARMAAYFHSRGMGAEVALYRSGGMDWLLTAALAGEDGAHGAYLMDPARLCDTLACALRGLHETDYTGCPVMDRTAAYLALAEENYRTGRYDSAQSPGRFGYRSAGEAHDVLARDRAALRGRVLLHGDYCLPNIILDRWKLSGFIDVGCGGVGDRHIDLFWGVWTL